MTSLSVTLVCEKCSRRMPYFRSSDPSLPHWVETIRVSQCDICHDGDRITESWRDGHGLERDPAPPPSSGEV
jgi:hypothetical protein